MAQSSLITPMSNKPHLANFFSKKGALALFWLFASQENGNGRNSQQFSINQIARETGVRPFTVYRIFKELEYEGIIKTHGLRTKKRFCLAEPKELMTRWLLSYQIQKKAVFHGYRVSDPKNFNKVQNKIIEYEGVPALHTAARMIYKARATNLMNAEIYLRPRSSFDKIVHEYKLIELDRGYELLLIEPYYFGLVEHFYLKSKNPIWKAAYALLTFLDLYHFPLRGREQAEVLFRSVPVFRNIGTWRDFEQIEGV